MARMSTPPPVLTPGHLDRAVAQSIRALSSAVDQDWSVPAEGMTWTCRATAEHLADCQVSYALLVTGRRQDSYLPLLLTLESDAETADVVAALGGSGTLLSSALRTAPADLVVWHPYGMADLSAVAGMGTVETLVHTWDIATALAAPFAPDPDLCADALARMFPEVSTDADPWQSLLWATGRADLPGRPRREGNWRWTNDLSAPPRPA
jgi:uncharacterized protein (TIGR03083 family)